MSWQQILLIVLFSADLGCALVKHGQPRAGEKHSFWSQLIADGILVGILLSAGFWN